MAKSSCSLQAGEDAPQKDRSGVYSLSSDVAWHEAMCPSLDAADHRWKDVAIIPVRLDHHLSGMEVVPPRASMARMRKILRVTRHHVHSRNATLTAPLGSLHLGLVVVHGKTKAGGDGDWRWRRDGRDGSGNGRQTVRRQSTGSGGDPRSRRMR